MTHDLRHYALIINKTIFRHQNPVTGLLPAHQISGCEDHAWIRDNVYSIMSVWALSMAYKRNATRQNHEDKAQRDLDHALFLEKSTVKCMRGLLLAMMGQRDKVEKFKTTLSDKDALHAKFCSKTGAPVVGDDQWGHLQIDAISLYLLTLAQMTASGLQIVFNLDEVAFVQNLVFYIERAYVTPDYGVWERGAKSNQGVRELNSSSIGMAKAALEALNKLDLFGWQGSHPSVSQIHTMPDDAARCSAVLESMLPRESNSKETDSAILSVIGFPAFAISDPDHVNQIADYIQQKLGGRYGMKRFLRDGYKTVNEDTNRLHYESWELRAFDNIECEWPLFYCYQALIHIFSDNNDIAREYCDLLEQLTVPNDDDGMKFLPELYMVTPENITQELAAPGSSERSPGGRCPFMWAQSLYVISRLLLEGLLSPGELDPLSRRLSPIQKPEIVVQVVVLAEDAHIQKLLLDQGIKIETVHDISPIIVKRAAVLSKLFSYLGKSEKLGLSGRGDTDVGILTTSIFYKIQGKTFVFTPQSLDHMTNYIDTDPSLAMSTLAYGLNYMSTSWTELGRPTITLILGHSMVENGKIPQPYITTLRKLGSGYIYGTRVMLGSHVQFQSTSCYTDLGFLGDLENGNTDFLRPEVVRFLEGQLGSGSFKGVLGKGGEKRRNSNENGHPGICVSMPMTGSMKRSRSILPDQAHDIQKHFEERNVGFKSIRESDTESDTDFNKSENSRGILRRQSTTEEERNFVVPMFPTTRRTRLDSEAQYMDTELEDLVDMLRSTNDMEIHGDILHYMVNTYGLTFKTSIGVIKELVKELHESACVAKHWSIVRHTHGLLAKKMQNMELSVMDLIVRQKQVTVGLPPDNEVIISQPLCSAELRELIYTTSGGDISTAALTQEVLCYLGMFVRTEPKLFTGMLRLRVGLILQVMLSEIRLSLNISDEEATEKLMNLSPFETKNLLHHIMSGREYNIDSSDSSLVIIPASRKISTIESSPRRRSIPGWMLDPGRKQSIFQSLKLKDESKKQSLGSNSSLSEDDEDDDEDDSRMGSWVRRRLLDGSLNRVPPGFYTRMWTLLLKSQGISLTGNTMYQSITQEMTSGELKFHLRCEALINSVPDPGLRQLVVEALHVLILCIEHNIVQFIPSIINVDKIVQEANRIFLEDMKKYGGQDQGSCVGDQGICIQFYDSAPGGEFGTMAYLTRATSNVVNFPEDLVLDCTIM